MSCQAQQLINKDPSSESNYCINIYFSGGAGGRGLFIQIAMSCLS